MMDEGFRKIERISSRRQEEELVSGGTVIFRYPFKAYYRSGTPQGIPRIIISVPKRRFKHAVDRNLVKRRVREAWRTSARRQMPAGGYDILFVYVGKTIEDYGTVKRKIGEIVEKIS